jgi:long-chain acyl-CoA synthetase
MSMTVADLFARMSAWGSAPAVISDDCCVSYDGLLRASEWWTLELHKDEIGAGTICGYLGDFSPKTIAFFLALMRMGAIAVPATKHVERELPRLAEIAGLERLVRFLPGDSTVIERLAPPKNPLVESFRQVGHPGLVVFTSGSTGQPKGILHDLTRVLSKFAVGRRGWRTVLFLMMDHFGGVNTLLSTLANGGVAVCVRERSPEAVCRAIAAAGAELLPTTPTFLNMVLATGGWRNHDLSSLRMITYGAEPMPQSTLRRVREVFPHVNLKQTYGLSELGVLHSKSPDPGSLWIQVGGAGFETRVVDGILHVRSCSSMVGYLNAPSPIDADGWMSTGDLVEVREGLFRFVGRVSEIINVGGQKVCPTEVESVLLEVDNIIDVTVFGTKHALLGEAVCAHISIAEPEPEAPLIDRLREHCRARLAKFKVPMRFELTNRSAQMTERAKKSRPDRDLPAARK